MKKLFRTLLASALFASARPGASHQHSFHRERVACMHMVGSGKPDLTRLTVKELHKLATAMKIRGRSKARRKADLVRLISKADQSPFHI